MHFLGGGVIGHPKSSSQKSHSIRAGISFIHIAGPWPSLRHVVCGHEAPGLGSKLSNAVKKFEANSPLATCPRFQAPNSFAIPVVGGRYCRICRKKR